MTETGMEKKYREFVERVYATYRHLGIDVRITDEGLTTSNISMGELDGDVVGALFDSIIDMWLEGGESSDIEYVMSRIEKRVASLLLQGVK